MNKSIFIGLITLPFVMSCTPKEDANTTIDKMEPAVNKTQIDTIVQGAIAELSAKSDSDVSGTVSFIEEDGKVKMTADLTGLTEGKHAIHIHEFGDCSSADGKSAGGHWNPTKEDHGKWGEDDFHQGDIGNIEADAEGNASYTSETDLWCISCDDETKNIIGKSIIVHKDADDFHSQPSGAAGARVACGEIVEK